MLKNAAPAAPVTTGMASPTDGCHRRRGTMRRLDNAAMPGGFTLIEMAIVMVIASLLATLALPGYAELLRKSRRSEAFVALMQIQHAQERWRANNTGYAGALGTDENGRGLGLLPTTAGGRYTLTLAAASATGYEAVATASRGGSQAADGDCSTLALRLEGGQIRYASGPRLTFADSNPCWNRR